MNCPDVDVFVFEFKSSIQRNEPYWSSQRIQAFLQESFINVFRTTICCSSFTLIMFVKITLIKFIKLFSFIWQAKQRLFDNRVNSDILKQMAERPLKHAQSFNVCYTNGYKFHTVLIFLIIFFNYHTFRSFIILKLN